MTDTRERNKEIAVLVLKGYTYKEVGYVFGITGERVRQISMKIYRKMAAKAIKYGIKNLRKSKNRIISLIEGGGYYEIL